MGSWTGVLAMTMVVRDEEDILPANFDYHLAQGVDVILVTDHGSTDHTPEILTEYERTGRVYADRDEVPAHDQVGRVNRLLRIAERSHGADWVIHCDADEFWLAGVGSLRDVFAAVPDRFGYLVVERRNFLPVSHDGRPFHQRMVFRERRTLNIRGEELEPKVAQRPVAGFGVTPGNHDLEDPVMERTPDIGAVTVGHFPMRTFEQFERKVVNTGTGYELLEDRAEGVGGDQLELLRIQRSGGLRAHYDAQLLDGERRQRSIERDELVVDRRLQAFLASGSTRAEESPWVQEVLRRAWLELGAAGHACAAAEARSAESQAAHSAAEQRAGDAEAALLEQRNDFEDQLQQARYEVAQLSETIAVIKASRTMRYTAHARRAYHRLRPGGNRRS